MARTVTIVIDGDLGDGHANFVNGVWGILKVARPDSGFHLEADGARRLATLMSGRPSRGDEGPVAVTAVMPAAVTVAEAADEFLSSPRVAIPNTRHAYSIVLKRLAAELGSARLLADVPGEDIAGALRHLWGGSAPVTWNRNRAAVASWLSWCSAKKRWPAPELSGNAEHRKECDSTKALSRGSVERLLSRHDIPLREKTL